MYSRTHYLPKMRTQVERKYLNENIQKMYIHSRKEGNLQSVLTITTKIN